MHILIIEDEPMLLNALTQEFERRTCRVSSATDGQDAVSILRRESSFSIILLDLILPHLNGFEVLKVIMDSPQLRRIPVVVLTNLSDETTISSIIAAGVTDYLVKADYTLKEIVDKVFEIIKRPALPQPGTHHTHAA